MNALRDLFPDEAFRFRMTMRRGDPAEFFLPLDRSGAILRERKVWLEQEPARYAGLMPEGSALLTEVKQLAATWGLDATGDINALARKWEPDFLLLSPDPEGRFRLRGGALCFPTSWALKDKLGQTLEHIHGVVPGLNSAIGPAIDKFMHGLRPGLAFLRENWGIAATDELNLHPVRRIASPQLPVRLDKLWLRVEHQVLVALPRGGGVLFGIRIELHRLDTVSRDPVVAAGLGSALRSMAPELVLYKGLAAVQNPLATSLIEKT